MLPEGCASQVVCVLPGGVLPEGCASGACIPACTRQTPPSSGNRITDDNYVAGGKKKFNAPCQT